MGGMYTNQMRSKKSEISFPEQGNNPICHVFVFYSDALFRKYSGLFRDILQFILDITQLPPPVGSADPGIWHSGAVAGIGFGVFLDCRELLGFERFEHFEHWWGKSFRRI